MIDLVDRYNVLVGGGVLVLTALFGAYWYIFATFLVFNIFDWLTGWLKARNLKEESSKVGLSGIVKKLGYWLIIATAFIVANTFVKMGSDILNINLSFLILIGWFTLASLMVNEVRSILENFVEMGYDVPDFLIKGLAVTDKLINKANESKEGDK